MTASLLLVEDHAETQRTVARLLEAAGFTVETAASAGAARTHLAASRPDGIILDWMLPDTSGLDFCRELRAAGDATPILLLTARGDVEDRVAGLDAGADDYVKKPFAPAELLARARALVRRGRQPMPDVVRVGEAEVRLAERRVVVGGAAVPVTAREFAILEVLLRRRGRAVSRGEITEAAWGDDHVNAEASLEVLVSRLRKKLAPGGGASPIETLRGFGYAIR